MRVGDGGDVERVDRCDRVEDVADAWSRSAMVAATWGVCGFRGLVLGVCADVGNGAGELVRDVIDERF